MIRHLSEITVRRFMVALFNKDYDGIEDFNAIYNSYLDVSGLSDAKHLALMVAIHNLNARINATNIFIKLMRDALSLKINLKVPLDDWFVEKLPFLKQYGHNIIYDKDNTDKFLEDLNRVESIEKRNVVERELLQKELDDLKTTGKFKQKDNDRLDFVQMLNALNKIGYKIDRDKTDMEELALMIKDMNEENKRVAAMQN